jgi:CHASE3 domain sensor protein
MAPESSQDKDANLDSALFRKLLTQNLILPLVIGFSLVMVFSYQIYSMIQVNKQLTQSYEILATASESREIIAEAESFARGYFVAKNEYFLDAHLRANNRFQKSLPELMELVADNPEQTKRLEGI